MLLLLFPLLLLFDIFIAVKWQLINYIYIFITIHLPVYLNLHLSIYLSIYPHISIHGSVSGSWDNTVSLWDRRADQPSVRNIQTPGKVYSLSVAGNKIVVATSDRHILIYDTRYVWLMFKCLYVCWYLFISVWIIVFMYICMYVYVYKFHLITHIKIPTSKTCMWLQFNSCQYNSYSNSFYLVSSYLILQYLYPYINDDSGICLKWQTRENLLLDIRRGRLPVVRTEHSLP